MELARTTNQQHEKLNKLGFPINKTSKHPTPTLAFALKWIRDVKGFSIIPYWNGDTMFYWIMEEIKCCLDGQIKKDSKNSINEEPHAWKTYEEAESAGLDFALDYLLK